MTTVEELYEITEKISDNLRNQVAELLIQALNDWRSQVNSIEDYSEQLKKLFEIKELTRSILETEMNRLNPETHSWELESITSLIEAFKLSRTEEISSLINYISEKAVK